MTRIISTDEELQALRDGTILLEAGDPDDSVEGLFDHWRYWIVSKDYKAGENSLYRAFQGWGVMAGHYAMRQPATVIFEPGGVLPTFAQSGEESNLEPYVTCTMCRSTSGFHVGQCKARGRL